MKDLKEDIDSNTLILGEFNTLPSKMDRACKQNINKDIVALNDAPNEMDLLIYVVHGSTQRKNYKTLKLMEIEYHAIKQWMGQD